MSVITISLSVYKEYINTQMEKKMFRHFVSINSINPIVKLPQKEITFHYVVEHSIIQWLKDSI